MRRFFFDFEFKDKEQLIIIEGDESKHILKVLRLKVGNKIILSNYNSQSFECEIVNIFNNTCSMKILEEVNILNKSPINITVFQGYPKSDKLELIVQKLTEIGVRRIVPLLTKRVDVKFNPERFRLDRLIKIAQEACKQCGISEIPKIENIQELKTITIENLSDYDLIIVPYECETQAFKEVLSRFKFLTNIAIFIGPEGGFENSEVDYIKKLGGIPVSLGKRIMRTETAAIVSSSIIQYEFGDIG